MDKIDLQLIQDNYTNLILYDDSNRGYAPTLWMDFADVKNITKILMTLKSTSDHLEADYVIEIASGSNLSDPMQYNAQVEFDFSTMVYQQGFKIEIPYTYIDDTYTSLPEGLWVVEFEIIHPTISTVVAETLNEYAYKQTEIYRDLLFLHIARNVGIYQPYYNNYMTERDKFRMQCLYFDANFKAMKSQIGIGNKAFIAKTLKWLQDFQKVNPINVITETND